MLLLVPVAFAAAGCGLFGSARTQPDPIARNDNPLTEIERQRDAESGINAARRPESAEMQQFRKELAVLPSKKRQEMLKILDGPNPPSDIEIRLLRGSLQKRYGSVNSDNGTRVANDRSQRPDGVDPGDRNRDEPPFSEGPGYSTQQTWRDPDAGRQPRESDAAYWDRHRRYDDRSPNRGAAYNDDPGLKRDTRYPNRDRLRDRGFDRGPERDPSRDRGFRDSTTRPDDPGTDTGPSLSEPTRLSKDWNDALRKLIVLTEARATGKKPQGKTNDPVRHQVYLRLLHLMSDNPARAATVIENAEGTEQEFWRDLVWGVFEYLHQSPEHTRSNRAARTIASLRKAMQHLRADADLEVRNLEFCRKIRSYGNYDTITRDERTGRVQFRPGERILMYAEVENFQTERTRDGHHKTRLRSTVELYYAPDDGQREFVKRFTFQPTEDVCRQYRRDYFHSYIIPLPNDLKLGNYLLKLTVEDIVSDRSKVGSDTVQFEVR